MSIRKNLLTMAAILAAALICNGPTRTGAAEPQTKRVHRWSILPVSFGASSITYAKRQFKKHVRSWVMNHAAKSMPRKQFGLTLDSGWEKTPPDKGLLIFIHGYQSNPQRHGSILSDVRKLGIPCGSLRYPNDQPIAQSAALLAKELQKIRRLQPRRPVTLLTISMGGLLARAVIEDPALDPGNVRRLIMVAPPTHGSNLARVVVAADVWEFVVKSKERSVMKRLFASFEDGLGEAAADLKPDSKFLTKLNARNRNAKTSYTVFLGNGGFVSEKGVRRLRQFINEHKDRNRVTRYLSERTLAALNDVEEIVDGKGDGIVAVSRGKLDGVKDTLVLRFRHWNMMDGKNPASQKLRAEILARLQVGRN